MKSHDPGEHDPQMSDPSQDASTGPLQPANPGDRSRPPDAEVRAPRVPELIGRYKVKRLIGQSNFQVYQAWDEQDKRDVAIKVFPREHARDPGPQEFLKKEAKKLATLNHPNIVKVYGYEEPAPAGRGEVGSGGFIVMEYIDGWDLEKLLPPNGKLPWEKLVQILAAVADALHHAINVGWVHRDIKPANILIGPDGGPRLCDFGLAIDEEIQSLRQGGLAGTYAYMAPEQVRGETHFLDGRTDIWALGVILYRGLTGRLPFRADDKAACSEEIRKRDPKPPREWDESVPKALEEICLRCLSREMHDRYRTAKDLAEDLRHWSDSGRTPAANPVHPKGLRSFGTDEASFFLTLLPGPRRVDGLPESIRFWKTRLEACDGEPAFRVGVIYGPSGAGKSSFVKAGLLPNLNPLLVRPVEVEATPDGTEKELKTRLRQLVTHLWGKAEGDLADTVRELRKGPQDKPPKKFLLVLDQFEQWLQGRRIELENGLVRALRQCDGQRVQALLVVRDDYATATHRLFEAVGERLATETNAVAVELFDGPHTRQVLAEFGRALEKLPQGEPPLDSPEGRFLSEAVAGLTRTSPHGRVIPLRLSEFVEVVRRRDWTPETLEELGGVERIEVKFLEQSFDSPWAALNAKHHGAAAKKVLRLLLTTASANLRGEPRSLQDLREASGYVASPEEFKGLLKVVDQNLRLITPVERGSPAPDGGATEAADRRFYQLTHDGLVSSLRDWFTENDENDSRTPRGWARVLLDDRASTWDHRKENRHLPSVWEHLTIRRHTRKSEWTPPQKRMMARAAWVHGRRAFVVLSGILLISGLAWYLYKGTVASGLVQQLRRAETVQVPEIVRAIGNYRWWADSDLKQVVAGSPDDSKENLHARLALLPVDPAQIPHLEKRLLDASPSELPVLRNALEPHASTLTPEFWDFLESASTEPGNPRLLAAASALALYDPGSPRWAGVGDKVARAVVAVYPVFVGSWLDALRPVGGRLTAPLSRICRDKARPETEHWIAASFLADFAKDQPAVVAEVLLDADPNMFATLFPVAQSQAAGTVPLFEAELARKPGPNAGESAKDEIAERQARAAVALVRLGKAERVWPLLRHSPDPRLRSFLVNWLPLLGADPHLIVAKLQEIDPKAKPGAKMEAILFHPETSMRRASILAIGENGTKGLSPDERDVLVEQLLGLYVDDPDSGIHSAAEWTLKQLGAKEDLQAKLDELVAKKPGDRRWHVNGQKQTFAVIEGPVEFRMGSPLQEPDRDDGEVPHLPRTIPHRFAIATKEVTIEQYRTFLARNPGAAPPKQNRYSPVSESLGPVNNIRWYEAAAYCNWLSKEEGIPEHEWCYLPNEEGKYDNGMRIRSNALQRRGYRLPSELEWEYACRAGAVTPRPYGASKGLLSYYAWYLVNSGDHTRECGSLKPNDLGLFDMLGNLWEWCQELHDPPTPFDPAAEQPVINGADRLLRGESFTDHPAYVRSARRDKNQPEQPGIRNGFRVARTVPASEPSRDRR